MDAVETAASVLPTASLIGATVSLATRSVIVALAPVSVNFTGLVPPCLKIELPSTLTGCRTSDQA